MTIEDQKLTELSAQIGELKIRTHRIEQEALSRKAFEEMMRIFDDRILALESIINARRSRKRK